MTFPSPYFYDIYCIVEIEHDFVSVSKVLLTPKPPQGLVAIFFSFELWPFRHYFGQIQPLVQACLLLLLLLSTGPHRSLTMFPALSTSAIGHWLFTGI